MKILIVHYGLCVRTMKFIHALEAKGHDIHVLYGISAGNKVIWGEELEKLLPGKVVYFINLAGLLRKLEEYRNKGFDIIQCANEPNWPTVAAINSKIAPVVFDCHDLTSVYVYDKKSRCIVDEKIALEQSDGVIFVGKRVEDYTRQIYKIEEPTVVCHSYVAQVYFQKKKKQIKEGIHIVYEGGIPLCPEAFSLSKNLWPVFRKIADQGIHIHIYPTKDIEEDYMKHSFIHIHNNLPYRELLKELSQYHYGFVGFNFDLPERRKKFLNAAMPNKLFDYIAAKIPIIVYNAQAISEFVEKHEIGFTPKNIGNLRKEIEGRKRECIFETLIRSLSMEVNIEKVEDLYRDIRVKAIERRKE